MLRWVAMAASKLDARYHMTGVLSELIGGNRVFTATDGHRLHTIELAGNPKEFDNIPTEAVLAFRADAKRFIFTKQLDVAFLDYKKVIPDTASVKPFEVVVRKDRDSGCTSALYEIYSRRIWVNAEHIAALAGIGDCIWEVYPAPKAAVARQTVGDATYTAVFAVWSS